MDERKQKLKELKKASAAVKRKNTALWSWLSILSLLLALLTTAASVCCILFGGAIGAYYSGKLWEPDSVDTAAIHFASDYKTPEERMAAMEALQQQAVTEGAVLLKNNGVLPLTAEINVDVLSVGNTGVAYEDALVVSADTPEECKQLNFEGQEKSVVLVLNTTDLPQLDFLEKVDACLWTGGTTNSKAVAELLTGKQAPSGSLAVTGCYNAAGTTADYQLCEAKYAAFVTGDIEDYDYSKLVAYPFGYGLRYTTFAYSNMTLSYDVATDTFSVAVTVTNTGDRAGRETVQLYVQTPYAVKLTGFVKTELLKPGSTQTVILTAERRALASYDATGTGGYVLTAGDYYFTAAANAHTAINQILAMQGYTPENTEGRMDVVGEPGLTGVYTQAETDNQSYRLSASGAEVKNRLGNGIADTQAEEMPVTGASNGLKLQALRGLRFDDPLWESFLDQMTHWEMAVLANVSFGGNMQYMPEETLPGSLLANAFDPELAGLAGKHTAEQCLEAGKYYLSTESIPTEDSFLAGTLFTAQIRGIREKGILAAVELENTAGLSEQIVREQLLEPYRIALQQGNGWIITESACFDIIKTEWGYAGALLEKESLALPIMQIVEGVITACRDSAAASALREQCHRSLYNLVNSAAMNGIGTDAQLRGVRLPWYNGVYIATGVLWILHIVMGAMYFAGRRKWKASSQYRDYSTMKTVLRAEKEKTAL